MRRTTTTAFCYPGVREKNRTRETRRRPDESPERYSLQHTRATATRAPRSAPRRGAGRARGARLYRRRGGLRSAQRWAHAAGAARCGCRCRLPARRGVTCVVCLSGQTLGSGPNVELVFKRILNVVYCSQTLLLLTLFKRCPRPKNGQNRVFQPKLRPRRLWRRPEPNRKRLLPSQKFDRYFEAMISVHVSSDGSKTCEAFP